MPFAVLRIDSGVYDSANARTSYSNRVEPVWDNYTRYGESSLPDELIRSLRTMYNKEFMPQVDTDNVLKQLSQVPKLTVLNWVEAIGWMLHSFSSVKGKYNSSSYIETYVFTHNIQPRATCNYEM
jgi:hypothetical protein